MATTICFLQFIERAVNEDFLKEDDRDLLLVSGRLEELLARLEAFAPGAIQIPGKLQRR